MRSQEDSVMDDPVVPQDTRFSHPDPAVNARLLSFPDNGDERRLLENWLASSSAQDWKINVMQARAILQIMTASVAELYTKKIRNLFPEEPLEYFKSIGMEREVVKTLFGEGECNVQSCSDDALIHLLHHGTEIDILIGSCLPSTITGDNSGSLSVSHSQELREAARRLNRCFTQEYCGPGALWLQDGLGWYMEMYDRQTHYGKTIVVLQSSGTGKSRAVAQLAKSQNHWGVSVCFRGMGSNESQDPRDGLPLGDEPACKFLSNPSGPLDLGFRPLKGEEIAAAFIGALFSAVCETIVDAKSARAAFDNFWGVPDVSDSNLKDSPRAKTFEKVRTKANALLVAQSQNILEARELMPTASVASFVEKGGTIPWVGRLYNILIKDFAEKLDKKRRELELACFTFIFDECSLLDFFLKARTGFPLDYITLLAVQRMIKTCDHFEFWFFMLDTTSALHDAYPPAKKDTSPSLRLPGKYTPLPPWPYLPFDVMVPSPKDLPKTPLEALCLDRLRVYGRPLWSTYHDDELMVAAAKKLVNENLEEFLKMDFLKSFEKLKLQVLALHSTRFILNLRAESAANKMAMASVKSHLRVLTHYNIATGMMTSEVPSEPILAIAAGKLLLDDKDKYKRAMKILVENLLLSSDVISLGESGETLARIILVVNRDATVHDKGGQMCVVEICGDTQKITEQKYGHGRPLNGNLYYAVRPFRLDSYLRNLVHTDKITQVDGAFDSGLLWAKQVHMNFTHFVQLDDYVPSSLSFEFVVMCWRRGVALQCVHGQPIINMLLIGYRGDLSKAFDPKMFVFVVLQVKNRFDAAGSGLINTITCPFLQDGSKRWKPEYMVVLMDMGTRTRFQSKHEVQVTAGKAVKGKAWAAFEKDEEYAAVRINIRGWTPYHSLAEWAPDMFQLQTSSPDLLKWHDALASTMKVTQGALNFSLEDMQESHDQRQKGYVEGV